jgi:hypothetical protein
MSTNSDTPNPNQIASNDSTSRTPPMARSGPPVPLRTVTLVPRSYPRAPFAISASTPSFASEYATNILAPPATAARFASAYFAASSGCDRR